MPNSLMGNKDGGNFLTKTTMKADKDLQFLQYCKNDDLVTLCNILTNDNKGGYRFTEQLTSTDNYINYYPQEMNKMWADIAWELQCYGGNTLLNVFMRHGKGPAYEEIVSDVCRKIKVSVPRHADTTQMEAQLLGKVIDKALSQMSEQELRNLCDELNLSYADKLPKSAIMTTLALTHQISIKMYMYLLRIILTFVERCLISRGVIICTGLALTRPLSLLLGPIGVAILIGMTVWDIMGPAYRVTIPAVIQVALMRMEYMASLEKKEAI